MRLGLAWAAARRVVSPVAAAAPAPTADARKPRRLTPAGSPQQTQERRKCRFDSAMSVLPSSARLIEADRRQSSAPGRRANGRRIDGHFTSRSTVFYQSVTISAGSVSYYRLIWWHRLTLKAPFTAPWLTDRTPGWGRLTGHQDGVDCARTHAPEYHCDRRRRIARRRSLGRVRFLARRVDRSPGPGRGRHLRQACDRARRIPHHASHRHA